MNILEVLTAKRAIGNVGEDAAARYLKKNGYKIVLRNFVAKDYEIDIIAESDDTVVFVEVKTRTIGRESPMEARPAASVTPEKQRKIITTAGSYISSAKPEKRIRFDVIEVYLSEKRKVKKICHLESAFTKDTAYKKHYHF